MKNRALWVFGICFAILIARHTSIENVSPPAYCRFPSCIMLLQSETGIGLRDSALSKSFLYVSISGISASKNGHPQTQPCEVKSI